MNDDALRRLPAVHVLADAAAGRGGAPRWAVVEAARRAVAVRREALLSGGPDEAAGGGPDPAAELARLADEVAAAARALAAPSLRRVINATGVVLHTNLGRAPLAAEARAAVARAAGGYSNLEYDLAAGARGSRHDHLVAVLRDLTGAEDAVVVNNNAAATMLGLAALAAGRGVVVSRGELVEIGGSFRIPDILRASGCRLVEVGTTNKTRRADYEAAIDDDTALLLKVHRSNFAIVGFTAEVEAAELAELARARGLASMVDLGSGAMIDAAAWRAMGLPAEPGVRAAVAAGLDLVCFSGDKLLGGPQAGILVGRAAAVARARRHPLMRALRPDKLTIAALAATLGLYRDGRWAEVPALAMLGADDAALRARADRLAAAIGARRTGLEVTVVRCASAVGGGAMPLAEPPSWAVALAGRPADAIDRALRAAPVPVVARVDDGRVLLDVRTIDDDEVDLAAAAAG